MVKVSGTGKLFVSSFGAVHEVNLAPDEEYIVDNGHIVAFDAKIPYTLEKAAKGLADLPLQVILTLGGRRDPVELGLGNVAQNVRIRQWVPDTEFIPRTAAVVTTGGAGTVLTALHAGVPLVVVPTEWDKPESAQRVVESGSGLRLQPRRCTPRSRRPSA